MQELRRWEEEEGSCSCSLWFPDCSAKSALKCMSSREWVSGGELRDAVQGGHNTHVTRSRSKEVPRTESPQNVDKGFGFQGL